MPALSYRTAGESHGKALTVLIEGLPAGLMLDLALINGELRRRQGGYGRGGRMRIEQDEVTSHVRAATLGSPLVLADRQSRCANRQAPCQFIACVSHADLAGSLVADHGLVTAH